MLTSKNGVRSINAKASQDTLRRAAKAENTELIWLMAQEREERRVLPSKATLEV